MLYIQAAINRTLKIKMCYSSGRVREIFLYFHPVMPRRPPPPLWVFLYKTVPLYAIHTIRIPIHVLSPVQLMLTKKKVAYVVLIARVL